MRRGRRHRSAPATAIAAMNQDDRYRNDYPSGAYQSSGLHTAQRSGRRDLRPPRRADATIAPPPPPARVQNPVPYRPSRAVAILRGDSDDAGPLNPDTSINRDTSKDWICESCENLNFSARRECKRCSKPRPARPRYATDQTEQESLESSGRARDWRCPACDNVNYAGRDRCNRCARPQPAHVSYVHQPTIPKDVCPTIKSGCRNPRSKRRTRSGTGKAVGWGPCSTETVAPFS